jgi:hypothetical protein
MNDAPGAPRDAYYKQMNTKHIAALALVGVAIAGVSFYGGTLYAKGNAGFRPGGTGTFTQSNFGSRGGMRGGAGGFSGGQILSMDSSSLTVKGPDGSTRIILLSASTTVMKTSSGSVADLSVGDEVSVTGAANSDGSITANAIQLRPTGNGFGGMPQMRPE